MTPIVAHRLVDRVRLWTDIREKLLSNEKLRELLDAAENGSMPSWWTPGEHDFTLLTSVDKYGNIFLACLPPPL